MIEKIKEQLDDYFKRSKKDFWIGIQNFQGVREYTKIPLAPLTLIYGQNSAGKSTIHDAQQFIHGYFSGQWDNKTTKEYLERWANHNRVSKPLAKGYIGNPEDVVISVCSVTGSDDCSDYQHLTYYHNKFSNKYAVTGLTKILFNPDHDVSIPFRMDIHFSNSFDDWIVRQISVYLGGDIVAEFIFDDSEKYDVQDGYALLRINKYHLVYSFLNGYFEDGIAPFSKYNFHQDDGGDNWFLFFDMDITGSLELKNLIGWYDVDECFWDSNPSTEIIEFRTFILSLLQIPAIGIAKNFNFASVPPLRPIPSKQNAVFRFHLNDYHDKSGWEALAEQIGFKTLHENLGGRAGSSFSSLYKINNFLSHESFLNTGYEITGKCLFLVPIHLIMQANHSNEEMSDLINKHEAEVHLKLKNKSNGYLVEIEDVGVGISQIIPVLTAIINSSEVFIQQPELHLHPKLQAQLADAFIETVNDHLQSGNFPTFIIESHSEHFLLRLLRRIRESHKSDNKESLRGLSSKNVSVLYVDKSEDGTSKIFPLRLSPEGDFIDRWPHGFFTERDGDLFDE